MWCSVARCGETGCGDDMPINAFRERSEHNLDAKGRLNIPARFLNNLATKESPELIIVPWIEHLRGYPIEEWAKLEEKLLSQEVIAASAGNEHFDTWVRLTLGSLSQVTPDKQGRVLISQTLRQHANLEKELILTGMGGWFEIWDKALLLAIEKEAMEKAKEHQKTLRNMGII